MLCAALASAGAHEAVPQNGVQAVYCPQRVEAVVRQ